MIILQDKKEKQPWNFRIYSDVKNQWLTSLDTADYTVLGYEKVIRIERKHSTSELAINLGSKSKQFIDELKRFQEIEHKFLICEFPIEYIMKFPAYSSIPKRRWKWLKMNGKVINKLLFQYCDYYNIQILFANNPFEAQELAINLFRKICN